MTSGASVPGVAERDHHLGLVAIRHALVEVLHDDRGVLIGNEMNSMPMFGSSISAFTTAGSDSGVKPAVVSSGLP